MADFGFSFGFATGAPAAYAGRRAYKLSIGELIRDRKLETDSALFAGNGIDLIGSSPLLAKVEREMVGSTSELAMQLKGKFAQ